MSVLIFLLKAFLLNLIYNSKKYVFILCFLDWKYSITLFKFIIFQTIFGTNYFIYTSIIDWNTLNNSRFCKQLTICSRRACTWVSSSALTLSSALSWSITFCRDWMRFRCCLSRVYWISKDEYISIIFMTNTFLILEPKTRNKRFLNLFLNTFAFYTLSHTNFLTE